MISKKEFNSQSSVKNTILEINKKIEIAAASSGRKLSDISLMAVTKTVGPEMINNAFDSGIVLFGENKVQEYLSKIDSYKFSKENVHFIGNLQTNKVKYIIDKVSMIESVSSQKLLVEINKCAKKNNLVMDVLLEVNIGCEETKGGFLPENISDMAEFADSLENISLRGLMTIPPKNNLDYFFGKMQQLFVDISQKKLDNSNIGVLSMGMSGDFETAIKYGSNIIRLGTAIFGARNYNIKED